MKIKQTYFIQKEMEGEATTTFKLFVWNVLYEPYAARSLCYDALTPFGKKIVDMMKFGCTDEVWSGEKMESLRKEIASNKDARKLFFTNRQPLIADYLKRVASERNIDVWLFQEISEPDLRLWSNYCLEVKNSQERRYACGCNYTGDYFVLGSDEDFGPGLGYMTVGKEQDFGPITGQIGMLSNPNRRPCLVNVYKGVVFACVHLRGYPVNKPGAETNNLAEAVHYAQGLREFHPDKCIVMAGDFNHPVSFKDGQKVDALSMALKQEGFVENVISPMPTSIMSETAFVKPEPFTIDRCFIYKGVVEKIEVDQEGRNYSDHTPLIITIKSNVLF